MTDRRLWVVAALLALAGIALNIVFWITRQRPNIETFEGPPRSDYTLGNFSLNALDGEGKLSFQTIGPFLARRGEDGSSGSTESAPASGSDASVAQEDFDAAIARVGPRAGAAA